MPQHPEALYTSVMAKNNDKTVIALYTTNLIDLPDTQASITHIINATGSSKTAFTNLANYKGIAKIFDCQGTMTEKVNIKDCDVAAYTIPISGRMEIID
jgi:hypothetical protein